MKKLNCLLLAMGLALFAESFCVMAQTPGDLDPTFGTGGKVILQIQTGLTSADGVAVQSDGKIVAVAGYDVEHLIRLNSDGSLDTTFDGDGIVTFTWTVGTSYGNVTALALQYVGGQERIVVAGTSFLQVGRKLVRALHVERFMTDGSVDTSFGTNGHTVINTGYALAIAIQPDGKVLTVGDVGNLVRLNSNGTLDTGFGSGGIVNSGYGRSLAVDSTSGILVGGYSIVGKGNNQRTVMSVKRYYSSGLADTGFGTSGLATADFGNNARADDLDIDLFGNIVASGSGAATSDIQSRDFAVARFTSNGLAETTFSVDGKTTFDFVGLNDTAGGLSFQSDGKMVQGGQIFIGNSIHDSGLVRLNYDGSVDTTFGNNGSVITDISGNDFRNGALIQFDPFCLCEKIVVFGGAAPNYSFARFMVQ